MRITRARKMDRSAQSTERKTKRFASLAWSTAALTALATTPLIIVAPASALGVPCTDTSKTFPAGVDTSYSVPAGVTAIDMQVAGASGGGVPGGGHGGAGASFAAMAVPVTSSGTVHVLVGSAGGGPGLLRLPGSGGGGGTFGYTTTGALVVAGGGGGGGGSSSGKNASMASSGTTDVSGQVSGGTSGSGGYGYNINGTPGGAGGAGISTGGGPARGDSQSPIGLLSPSTTGYGVAPPAGGYSGASGGNSPSVGGAGGMPTSQFIGTSGGFGGGGAAEAGGGGGGGYSGGAGSLDDGGGGGGSFSVVPMTNIGSNTGNGSATFTEQVSYDANGGSGAPAAVTVAPGCVPNQPTTAPTWAGHTFGGWATTSTGTNDYFTHPTGIGADTKLFAIWQSATPTLTITANNASMAYGGSFPILSVSYSGFTGSDNASSLTTAPSIASTAAPSSPVGTYSITPMGAVDSKYTIDYVSGTLTITPAALTITANNQSMTAGGTVPPLTASYTGFVNGDSASSLSTQPTCSTTANGASAPGQYPITCTGAIDHNYTINYAPGTMTVNAAPPTISPATLPDGTIGTPYAQTLTASGDPLATLGYAYTVSTGALPPGLSLKSATGAITGTPTAAGRYSFTVSAQGQMINFAGVACIPFASFTCPPALISDPSLPGLQNYMVMVNQPVTVTFNAEGGSPTPAPQTITSGATATQPAVPTLANQQFLGWFAPNATTAWNFSTPVTANLTLSAHWSGPQASLIAQVWTGNSLIDPADQFTVSAGNASVTGASGQSAPVSVGVGVAFTIKDVKAAGSTPMAGYWANAECTGSDGSSDPLGEATDPSAPTWTFTPTAPGVTYTCWVNNLAPALRLVSVVSPYRIDPGDQFTVAVQGLAGASTTTSGTSLFASSNYVTVTAGTTYTLTASKAAGLTPISRYVPSLTCQAGSGAIVAQPGSAPDPSAPQWTFTIPATASWFTCAVTFTATYPVTFDSRGGSPVGSEQIASGAAATPPTAPSRNGYTFQGWYTQATGGTNYFTAPTPITSATILYAHWSIRNPLTVTFNAEGGSPNPVAQTVPAGASASAPATAPTLTNHAFDGWYTTPTGGNPFDFATPITAPLTLYAQWTGVTVTPTTVAQGGQVTITGTGYQPGEQVTAVLHSTPLTLGTFTANNQGTVTFTTTIPTSFSTGAHTVVLTGGTSRRTASAALTVTAGATTPTNYPTQAATGISGPQPTPQPNRSESTATSVLGVLPRRRLRR